MRLKKISGLLLSVLILAGCQSTKPSKQFQAYIDSQGGTIRSLTPDLLTVNLSKDQKEQLGDCALPFYDYSFEQSEVIDKVEGFTSRMSGYKPAIHSREAEHFAAQISQASTRAFMNNDEQAKGRIIKTLARWANADALLATESCVQSNGMLSNAEECKEWRVPDGSDLSSMKDATFVTMIMAGLHRTYVNLLANSNPQLQQEHSAISLWLGDKLDRRLKKPSEVYFGLNMGWYWPSIDQDLVRKDYVSAQSKTKKMLAGVEGLINADGSIKERTTRGDRALWYHMSGLSEIMVSMEYARALNVKIPSTLETKLHKAVTLFLNGLDDHSYLDPWASNRHHATYSGNQDWSDNWMRNGNMNTSWLFAYQLRYPLTQNTSRLNKYVPINSKSATTDIDYGFGVGCLYNARALSQK